MDVWTSETCWALNNEIKKQVTSSWSLFIQLCILFVVHKNKLHSQCDVKSCTVMEQAATSHLSNPSVRTRWTDGLGIPGSKAISSQIIVSLFLQNGTNNGRRCVVSWSFRPTLSWVPPWQGRNLRNWSETLRRSTFWATALLLQHFKGCLKFFATFKNLYLFIPRFLAELWLEEKKSVLYSESRASVFVWKIFDSSG